MEAMAWYECDQVSSNTREEKYGKVTPGALRNRD